MRCMLEPLVAKATSARILIVEDDGPLLEVLQYVLEDEGYEVFTAEDGAAALDLATDHRVDLVLLDVAMSRMSGLEVANALRRNAETSGIAIALHTGVDEATVRASGAEFDLFVPKADDVQILLRSIDSLLAAKRRSPRAQ